MTINYLILIAGMLFATLTLHASTNAKKNYAQHTSLTSALLHIASTLSLYALTAWGILTFEWWIPFLVFAVIFQILRLVVTKSNWEKFWRAIPITGSLASAITCGAWLKWAFV